MPNKTVFRQSVSRPLRGFTLIELMVTLAVVATIAFVGLPSFTTLVENNRVTTQTNEVVSALNYARSEAIRRGQRVTVRAATGGFGNGMCVHLAGQDCDNPLREYPASSRVDVNETSPFVTFDGVGAKNTPAGIVFMTLLPAGCAPGANNRARALRIGNTGQVSVARDDCP